MATSDCITSGHNRRATKRARPISSTKRNQFLTVSPRQLTGLLVCLLQLQAALGRPTLFAPPPPPSPPLWPPPNNNSLAPNGTLIRPTAPPQLHTAAPNLTHKPSACKPSCAPPASNLPPPPPPPPPQPSPLVASRGRDVIRAASGSPGALAHIISRPPQVVHARPLRGGQGGLPLAPPPPPARLGAQLRGGGGAPPIRQTLLTSVIQKGTGAGQQQAPLLLPPLQPLPQAPANPLYKSLLSLQNPRLFGGDILLRMSRRPPAAGRLFKFERSALVSDVSRWPNGLIFYQLDPSVRHLARLIWSVMQQFHDETCIRFMPRLNNEPDFLRIEAHRGCFSYIGRVGGEQTLSLGDGCDYRGTIAHELLHAVGFYHHQNRADRDDFLEILWENIAKGKEGQFEKMAPGEPTGQLNEFDYNSIMLYGPRTFGKTLDKITMKPKREGVILLEVLEKQGLSALDIDSVNKLYKCEPYATYEPA